jgi:hypothetical protein
MHANSGGHVASSVQPVAPGGHTPGQIPPQPSAGLAHVADEQLGVHTQIWPQSASAAPHSVGSLDGQRGSTHTSATDA